VYAAAEWKTGQNGVMVTIFQKINADPRRGRVEDYAKRLERLYLDFARSAKNGPMICT
jgi:hypothetical protein